MDDKLIELHRVASNIYVTKMANGAVRGDKKELMLECIEDARMLMDLIEQQ